METMTLQNSFALLINKKDDGNRPRRSKRQPPSTAGEVHERCHGGDAPTQPRRDSNRPRSKSDQEHDQDRDIHSPNRCNDHEAISKVDHRKKKSAKPGNKVWRKVQKGLNKLLLFALIVLWASPLISRTFGFICNFGKY